MTTGAMDAGDTSEGARLRRAREAAGLSQAELAARAGVSRQLVGAAEAGRHLPRVDAALALARVLGAGIEGIFGPEGAPVDVLGGSLPEGALVRLARVGERVIGHPVPEHADPYGWRVADGVVERGRVRRFSETEPEQLVAAGCDPALTLAERLVGGSRAGLLSVLCSTDAAAEALGDGRTHVAVVHGPQGASPPPPAGLAVRGWHLARWRVGLAAPAGSRSGVWRSALEGRLRVVQREAGAAVQRSFEAAVARAGGSRPKGPIVRGHLEAARLAGDRRLVAVTIEPAAIACGLAFRPLEVHAAHVWAAEAHLGHPGLGRLGELLTSASFQRRLEGIGGYDLTGCGGTVAPP